MQTFFGALRAATAYRTIAIVLGMVLAPASIAHARTDVQRGQYLAQAAGCAGCHTDTKAGAVPYAGRRALETPFGTFYGPNITPDRETGIGAWSLADFQRAIRRGERPDGSHYFPAFPYPSFTGMADADIQDLWAYLRSLSPVRQANTPHDLRFPFGWRSPVVFWKWLFFTPGSDAAVAPTVAKPVDRGAYLVRVLGHCGECHTPRNFLGGPKKDSPLSGAKIPEGKVPNITPTRMQKWSDAELRDYFTHGTSPNGDIALGPMGEVITNTTSKLTGDDLSALIAYLRTLRPLPDTAQ